MNYAAQKEPRNFFACLFCGNFFRDFLNCGFVQII